MARQMVGQRKGGLPPNPPTHDTSESDTGADDSRTDDAGSENGDPDVVECPNCACQFNEASGDVVKPGKPVDGGSEYDGPDLEQPQHPVPGRMGAAHDAAVGDSVMASLLSGLKGSMGGAR